MADEVADSLATLNDVRDGGVPYRRMGDPLPTADRPHLGRIQVRSRRCRWSPLSVLLLCASSVTTWASWSSVNRESEWPSSPCAVERD